MRRLLQKTFATIGMYPSIFHVKCNPVKLSKEELERFQNGYSINKRAKEYLKRGR